MASARVPRNAPCPCGSGRKHKLCCGHTRAEERAAAEALGLLREAASLPGMFPRLRPACRSFDRWADRVAAGGLDLERIDGGVLEEGIAVLPRRERHRIARLAERMPEPLLPEDLLRRALLAGAVVAGLRERVLPERGVLELIEEDADLRTDPAEALALTLRATDLWSVAEAALAEDAVSGLPDELDDDAYEAAWEAVLGHLSEELAVRWHRNRLAVLVRRLHAQLPFGDFPHATATLEAACTAFEREPRLRSRLLAFLLADTLGPVPAAHVGLAA